jgi:MerR family mercuric resistance operon transcriptional regulator
MAMTIGRLAKAAGVNVETIRYYQRRGLLTEPRKPPGGHRRYADEALHRIEFIRRAQQLGFTLEEIGQLLDQADGPACKEARHVAEKRLEVIKSRIAELSRMRGELDRLIAACRRSRSACPLIDYLYGK